MIGGGCLSCLSSVRRLADRRLQLVAKRAAAAQCAEAARLDNFAAAITTTTNFNGNFYLLNWPRYPHRRRTGSSLAGRSATFAGADANFNSLSSLTLARLNKRRVASGRASVVLLV